MTGNAPSEAKSESAGTAITSSAKPSSGGEIRLSFRYFYVVLKWGQEKRSAERIDRERELFPALTATHAPVLAAVWAAFFLALYFLLVKAFEMLVYLVA